MATRIITSYAFGNIAYSNKEQEAFKQHISTISPRKAKTRTIRKDYSEHLNRTDDKILPLKDRI